ncbi:MAG: hypothetical protein RJQ04_21265 [Longimicrobiales bacterium]
MHLTEAQADLRRAYADGGPGVVVSGLVWVAASVVEVRSGVGPAFAVLFFGGMFIFPVALFVNRVLLRRSAESPENPFGRLVLEGTVAMIGGLFAAWLFLPHDPALVMPLAAVAVGTHYFAFRTAYGMGVFWVLGAVVTALGVGAIYGVLPLPGGLVLVVGLVEIVFGVVLAARGMARPA